ncbi:MAG: major capsid protein [Myxococcota bacterium]
MAVLAQEFPTLADVVKATDAKGQMLTPFVEPLMKRLALLNVLPLVECNDGTGHVFGSRIARPSLGWRKINQGIDPSKSRRAQIRETTGILEGRSEIDVDLVQINGNTASFRLDEEKGFIDEMAEEVSTGMFYHSVATSPEKFHGLTDRFDDETDDQVIDAETADATGGENASIWLLGFSKDTVFGIYPEGTPGGLERYDHGRIPVEDRDGKKFDAWVTNWKWKIGLCVKDERYVVRICNIERDELAADRTSGANLADLMTQAVDLLWSTDGVQPAFFMDRTLLTMLRRQTLNDQRGNYLGWEKIPGLPGVTPNWAGIPILRDDALAVDEDEVT